MTLGKKLKLDKLLKPVCYKLFKKGYIPKKIYDNIVLAKYNAIYFPISKVGNSSLKKSIADVLGLKSKDTTNCIHPLEKAIHDINFPFLNITGKNTEDFDNYFKFAFVRNPYDRLVSCYVNRIMKEKKSDKTFIKGVHKNFLTLGKFKAGMSFESFVKEICKISDKKADRHFKSQYVFLVDNAGKLIPDYIGRFESLNADWDIVCKELGIIGAELPHLMKSDHKSYKEYYTEDLKDMVAKRYEKDLELFGYKF